MGWLNSQIGVSMIIFNPDRQNEYRDKESAQRIAQETGGVFVDKEFKDIFGSYWIVVWNDYYDKR